MHKRLLSLGSLILLWTLLALLIGNDVILPTPWSVLGRLVELMTTGVFYESIFMTFMRSHIAFILSLLVGIGLALVCFKYEKLEEILSIWIKGLQTIPQISFVIFLYFMLDARWCVYVVVILMAFPISYFNYLEGLRSIGKDYRDMILLTQHSWSYLVKKIYLPMCKPQLASTLKAALPLSLKVCVMSEVLIYTSSGIGKQLTLAKSAIDMTSVFAWTIAFVGLVSLEMGILNKKLKRFY